MAPGTFKLHPAALHSPQLLPLTDTAFALWMKSGCWCVQHDRTFSVPQHLLPFFGGRLRHAGELVDAGLWARRPQAFVFVDSWHWGYTVQPARPKIPIPLRATVLARDGDQCLTCGATNDLQMDHIYPWSRGGPTTLENLQTLCGSCNKKKGSRIHVVQSR